MKKQADFSLSSHQIFSEFRISRLDAEQKYNGKVIEITGILDKIETPDS